MSATRSRQEEKNYKHYLKNLDPALCVFCKPEGEKLLQKEKYFKVIRNLFAYSIWDGQHVDDHLLIVPIKHIDSVAHFTDKMIVEYHKLLSQYEQKGYNTYARAPQSKIKSIPHQHTHLIKTSGDSKKLIFLLRKPYYLRVAA